MRLPRQSPFEFPRLQRRRTVSLGLARRIAGIPAMCQHRWRDAALQTELCIRGIRIQKLARVFLIVLWRESTHSHTTEIHRFPYKRLGVTGSARVIPGRLVAKSAAVHEKGYRLPLPPSAGCSTLSTPDPSPP